LLAKVAAAQRHCMIQQQDTMSKEDPPSKRCVGWGDNTVSI